MCLWRTLSYTVTVTEPSAICGEEDVETLKFVELQDEASGYVTSCHEEVIAMIMSSY